MNSEQNSTTQQPQQQPYQQQPQQPYQQQPPQYQQQQQYQSQQQQYHQPPQYPQQPGAPTKKQSFFTDALSTGDKVMYCVLGVLLPLIGIVCLYFSTDRGYEGMVRDKAKWILIGVVAGILVKIVLSLLGATGLCASLIDLNYRTIV